MTLDDLPTPCLLVERHRLASNLNAMQARADAQDVALRPHVKTHKSIDLARQQVSRGARGLTVATVTEAETFAQAGFDDLRLAYTVVGADKLARLRQLCAEGTRISFCVDTPQGARAASEAFADAERPVEVLLEVDTGYGRCGVRWDDEAATELAQLVAELPGLRLAGLLTHAGHAYHGPDEGETKAEALCGAMAEERDRLLELAVRLQKAGIEAARPGAFELSVGSTPSMACFANRTLGDFRITEIRPGNYVFYDGIQVALGAADWPQCALTVLATVVSKHRDDRGRERAFLDAGKKVLTSDGGYSLTGHGTILYNTRTMTPLPHARLTKLSEEHGWVEAPGGLTLEVGDRVRVVPNHACVTVYTQDRLYLVDGEEVIGQLSVDARSHG